LPRFRRGSQRSEGNANNGALATDPARPLVLRCRACRRRERFGLRGLSNFFACLPCFQPLLKIIGFFQDFVNVIGGNWFPFYFKIKTEKFFCLLCIGFDFFFHYLSGRLRIAARGIEHGFKLFYLEWYKFFGN
jgi:hypothetical protein